MEIDVTAGADALGEEGEGELTEWLAEDGAHVTAGDVIAEIETAKVLAEVTVPATGRLRRLVEIGGIIGADTVIAKITVA